MHYDGNIWTTFTLSKFQLGRLSAVFAVARNDVWAVGWNGQVGATRGLALHWDGLSWTQVTVPAQSGGGILLKSVSGAATKDVWAAGMYHYYDIFGNLQNSARAFHWNGLRWQAVTVGLGGYSYLNSIAVRQTNDVWAVGAGFVGTSQQYTYATLHWDGSHWSNVTNPNEGVLDAVSAFSSSDVWAVGRGFVTPGTHTIRYSAP